VVFNERHLRRLLAEYVAYYHEDRTHYALEKETPGGRLPDTTGRRRNWSMDFGERQASLAWRARWNLRWGNEKKGSPTVQDGHRCIIRPAIREEP
jgi:hypothetical protein